MTKASKKFAASKWLAAIGLLPLAYALLNIATARGEDPAVGNALVIAALFFGGGAGRLAGWLICKFLITMSYDFEDRLKASLSAFGFFSLPWIAAVWTNEEFGTEITLLSLEMHVFWSCVVAIFAFFATPTNE